MFFKNISEYYEWPQINIVWFELERIFILKIGMYREEKQETLGDRPVTLQGTIMPLPPTLRPF